MSEPAVGARAHPGRWTSAVVAAVVLALTAFALAQGRRHGTDLEVYWRAARRLLAAQPLYPAADGLRTYRYAPGAALLFAPLSPLPLGLARLLWYVVLVALGAAIAALLARADPEPGPHLLVAALGIVRPLLDELHYAQANLVVLALALLAFAAEDRGRDLLAGVFLALATALKLAPALLALDLVARRRWRGLLGFAVGGAVVAALPLPFLGLAGTIEAHLAWAASLRGSALGLAASPGNQSLLGMALRAGLPGWCGTAASALVVLAALRAGCPEPRRSLACLAVALAAPLGWIWNFVLAWPAMLLLARRGGAAAWLVGGFGLLSLVPLYDVGGPRLERWVFEHSLFGACMVGLFAATALLRPGRPRAAAESRSG